MTGDHADFYVGIGTDARWLGSWAEFGDPVELAGHAAQTARALSAATPAGYEAAVEALLTGQPVSEVGFVALPGSGQTVGWSWLATTSSGWYAYALADGHVRVSFHGGPWFIPDMDRADGPPPEWPGTPSGPSWATPPPKTATFTWDRLPGPADPDHDRDSSADRATTGNDRTGRPSSATTSG